MLIAIFANYFTLLAIFGFSYLFKKIIFKNDIVEVENIDFFYGIVFLIFLAIFINFFFPLKYFSLVLIVFGFIVFLFTKYYEKNLKINIFYYFLIVAFTTFVSFNNGNNVDSPMYHLQIIKWLSLHKVHLGLANLEIRFGFNSSWHSLIALLDLNIGKFSSKHYLSAIIFSVLIYEIIRFKKNLNLSDIFLFLTISLLVLFNFLHPFHNGVIFNHLGNTERDIVSMFFVFVIFFIFQKIKENKKDNINLIHLLVVVSFISVTTRLTTIPVILLPIFAAFYNKKYKIINFTNIFIIFTGFLWMIRNFFLSGCFLFPVKQTCFNTMWSAKIDDIIFLVQEAMSYTRTHPHPNPYYNKFDHTIYSYDWLLPWIKNYFLQTALLQICSLVFLLSFLLIITTRIFKKLFNTKFFLDIYDFFVIFVLLITFFIWFRAPEIRYAWGSIIVFPCFFLILSIQSINLDNFIKSKYKLVLSSFVFCLILLFSKNYNFFDKKNLFIMSKKNFDYSYIKKVGFFDGKNIYNCEWRGASFNKICVNTVKKNYYVKEKFSYTLFLTN